jgi:hypothetical protein
MTHRGTLLSLDPAAPLASTAQGRCVVVPTSKRRAVSATGCRRPMAVSRHDGVRADARSLYCQIELQFDISLDLRRTRTYVRNPGTSRVGASGEVSRAEGEDRLAPCGTRRWAATKAGERPSDSFGPASQRHLLVPRDGAKDGPTRPADCCLAAPVGQWRTACPAYPASKRPVLGDLSGGTDLMA